MTAYQKPDALTRFVLNPAIAGLTRLGLSLRGSRVLYVKGRKSGKWRSTPINPLTMEDGTRYLVAPRGVTQWVRNIRASGEARLQVGRKTEAIRVEEVPVEERPPILREYLKRWRTETGKFFGVSKNPSPEELGRVAPNHPVFRIIDGGGERG